MTRHNRQSNGSLDCGRDMRTITIYRRCEDSWMHAGRQPRKSIWWDSKSLHNMVGSKGFSQQYKLDLDKILSLIAKINTVQVKIGIVASKGWKSKKKKVKYVFQHG